MTSEKPIKVYVPVQAVFSPESPSHPIAEGCFSQKSRI